MKTAIAEKSPAFHAGFATGVMLDNKSDSRRKIDAELDSMSLSEKTHLLIALMLWAGELVVEDGKFYRVNAETGRRKLIA